MIVERQSKKRILLKHVGSNINQALFECADSAANCNESVSIKGSDGA